MNKSFKITKKFMVYMTIWIFTSSVISSLLSMDHYCFYGISKSIVASLVGTSVGLGVLILIYKFTNKKEGEKL